MGQTTNPEARWAKHKNVAKNIFSTPYKSHLYNSMNKYGYDNFSFKIIEKCDYEILDAKEKYWINKLNTLEPYGYNIKNGGKKLFGKDNPFYEKHHSEETKRIISEKNSGRKASEEEKIMRSELNKGNKNPFYGKHHSEETKRKIKETNIKRGNYHNASERMKLNNPNDGTFFNKPVIMLNDKSDIIMLFESAKKAGDYIKQIGLSKAKIPSNSISDVCRGNQKSAFGFFWRYAKPIFKSNFSEKTSGYIIAKK